jgi:hypothetical protein
MAAEPPAHFALTPALVSNAPIDYSTTQGLKLWQSATAKLADDLYDGSADGLRDFLELMRNRATIAGWTNSVMAVPNDIADPLGPSKSFLDHYGEITMQHLLDWTDTFINTQTRAAQDSVQLYACAYNSLTKEARDKVTIHRADYIRRDNHWKSMLMPTLLVTGIEHWQAEIEQRLARVTAT